MKKLSILFITLMFSGLALQAQKFTAAAGSQVGWYGEKVTGSHTGKVKIKDGNFVLKNNKVESGMIVIDLNTITCDDLEGEWHDKLVNHLKSDDFFGVSSHPTAKFVIKESGDFSSGNAEVKGDLTIKGITHPASFNAVMVDENGGKRIKGRVMIDRSKYDMKYNSGSFFSNLGEYLIYDEFKVNLDVLFTK